MPVIQFNRNHLMLPDVFGTHQLNELTPIASLLKVPSKSYVALIRACKLYQDALWIAESEPNLAWIMLVSALETAAIDHFKSVRNPVEQLKVALPAVAKLLIPFGDELVSKVANKLSGITGSTKKFIDLVLHFLPDIPEKRPSTPWLRINPKKDLRIQINRTSRGDSFSHTDVGCALLCWGE